MDLSSLKPSLHSYTANQPDQQMFYDKGDNSGRLHVYDGTDKNPVIWDTTRKKPAIFTFSGPWIEFAVWVALEESVPPGTTLYAQGDLNDAWLTSEIGGDPTTMAGTVSDDGKLVKFDVFFQFTPFGDLEDVPWCFNSTMSWCISTDSSITTSTPVSGSAPVEFYHIHPSQPQFFLIEGIPIDLLRLFIPFNVLGLTTEQHWINWVTNVCHGKQDPKGTPGELRADSTQHWLRYNVWDGAFSFVDEDGGPFSLMGWLNTYKDHQSDPAKSLRLVNCFDQAAIVEIALGLGISYKRLHWEIVGPFGYIDADLTGWGSTNSPFFEGDTQNMRFQNVADPMRTPFRSHVFITISPKDSETYEKTTSMVVDACAGPVAGDLSYTDYLKSKALQDGIELLTQGHTLPKQPWNGVQTTTGTLNGWTLNDKLENYHPDSTVHMPTVLSELNTAFATTPSVSDNFDPQTVINTIFQPIVSNTSTAIVLESNPQPVVVKVLNDSTIVSGALTTRLSIAGVVQGGSPTFISFQISAFSGGIDSAVAGLQQRLKAFTLPTKWVTENKINIKKQLMQSPDGMHDQRAKIFGTYHLNVFLYKNLVIQVAGNSNSSSNALPGWTKALWQELLNY